jgi:nucleoside-triphosphatase THEP1
MSLYEEHLEAIKKSAIGNTVEEVSEEAKRTGWSIRVMKQDGKDCVGTCDYNPGRLNVAVDNGKITEILGFG